MLISWQDRADLPIDASSLLSIDQPRVAPHEASRVFRRRELLEIPLLLLLSEANLGLLTACDAKLPVRWTQPPAYSENLFVAAVAEQPSAVFLRCSLPSRCWDLNSAIFHSKITVFPRHWAL